jgi:hypothetical protein
MRGSAGASLCSSGAFLTLSLANLDLMVKLAPAQTAALNDLKHVAQAYSEQMSRACSGPEPASAPARLLAAKTRLKGALEGVSKLEAAANKFYSELNDEQKAQVNNLVDWPGL